MVKGRRDEQTGGRAIIFLIWDIGRLKHNYVEQEQLIRLEDESGDRKYFTIIPNYILNHSTAVAQALYLQLKRLAGERGIAYPGRRYLMEKLGISYPTLKKEMDYLLSKGWIKANGTKEVQTDGGKQQVKCYKIVDLWELNNTFYQGGVKIEPPTPRGERIEPQGVKSGGERIEPKEEPLEQEPPSKKKENKFSQPSLLDVKNYCDERNNGVDAEQFINFYEAKGWFIGKNRMKDWRAAVRTWEGRGTKKSENKKAFYHGCPMIQEYGKWYVIERGGKILFTGKLSEIIYQ